MAALRWSEAEKCLYVCAIGVVFLLASVALAGLALLVADTTPYLNPAGVRIFIVALVACLAGWMALTLISWLARAGEAERHPWLVRLVVHYYALGLILGAYFLGPLTSTYAPPAIISAAVVGMLLFGVRSVISPMLVGIGVILGLIVLERFGIIPHAPVLNGPPFVGDRPGWLWTITMSAVAGLLVVLMLPPVAHLVWSWRDREEQLAETNLYLNSTLEQLRESRTQLVRAESLAALGSLVNGAAHELRNPLASSQAMLESLAEDFASAEEWDPAEREEALELLAGIRRHQRQASRIVERLYGLSDQLAFVTAERRPLVLVDELRRRFPGLRVELGELPPFACFSERALTEALVNLIENAFAAGGETPPVLGVRKDDDRLLFELRDGGRGIPPEEQHLVFEPFERASNAWEEGDGLGLYVVRELITRMGGSVHLDSEPGEGTTVAVRIPL